MGSGYTGERRYLCIYCKWIKRKHFNTTIQQETTTMKTIRVVAAIILADNKIFATQRG